MTALAPPTSPDWTALWLRDRGSLLRVVPDIDAVAKAHSDGILFLSAPLGAPLVVLRHVVRWLAGQGIGIVCPELLAVGDEDFSGLRRVLLRASAAVLVAPVQRWGQSLRVWGEVHQAMACNVPVWVLGGAV
jgi:hypothetical protein